MSISPAETEEGGPFRDLLAALSRLLPVHFVLGDGRRVLYSTEALDGGRPFGESIVALSALVMERNEVVREGPDSAAPFYGAPMMTDDGAIGAIIGYEGRPKAVSCPGALESLTACLGRSMGEWSSARRKWDETVEQLSESFEIMSLYSRLTPRIASLGFSGGTLDDLFKDLVETMGADAVFSHMPGRPEYTVYASGDGATSVADPPSFARSCVAAVPSEAPSLKDGYFIVEDSRSLPSYRGLHDEPFRLLAARVEHQGRDYGWLGLVSFRIEEEFRFSDLRIMTSVARQLAVALTNADLYRELERFLVNVVKSLVYTIEAKDPYTRGHSERVSEYCMQVAERLGLPEAEKKQLFWASILHDLGKIGIPESLLNKPGSLTKAEYEEIKAHPEKGYDILRPIVPLAPSLPGILHHHERYDGKGYPKGLKGEDIPLAARIIAAADTFDAITSDRSYRPGKTKEEGLAIMRQIAGSQLDAGLVGTFVALFDGAKAGAVEPRGGA